MTEKALESESEIYGVSHIDVPVASLDRAVRFYASGLGFAKRQSGEGWVDIDANSMLLRLVEISGMGRRATFRVQVSNVAAACRQLVAAGASKLYDETRTPDQELVASIKDLDGNTVFLWRALTEDEYGFIPDLPVETQWSPEAEALLKSLLLAVPAIFRALARRKVVRLAEELFPDKVISKTDVVRAYILSSARITRYRLREPLKRHGFDPDDYREEFEAE